MDLRTVGGSALLAGPSERLAGNPHTVQVYLHSTMVIMSMDLWDEMQSPMNVESALRYLQCSRCGQTKQLTFDELEDVFLSAGTLSRYICTDCEERDASRRKSKTGQSA